MPRAEVLARNQSVLRVARSRIGGLLVSLVLDDPSRIVGIGGSALICTATHAVESRYRSSTFLDRSA